MGYLGHLSQRLPIQCAGSRLDSGVGDTMSLQTMSRESLVVAANLSRRKADEMAVYRTRIAAPGLEPGHS